MLYTWSTPMEGVYKSYPLPLLTPPSVCLAVSPCRAVCELPAQRQSVRTEVCARMPVRRWCVNHGSGVVRRCAASRFFVRATAMWGCALTDSGLAACGNIHERGEGLYGPCVGAELARGLKLYPRGQDRTPSMHGRCSSGSSRSHGVAPLPSPRGNAHQ